MRFVLNVLWLLLSGIWLAIGYAFFALLVSLTVIGIPFGLQLFKLAGYVLWPFGRTAVKTSEIPGVSTIGNILWLPAGLFLALSHVVAGVVSAITIIGIPFAVANFKLVGLALTPFGRTVMSNREISAAVADSRAAAVPAS